tara:strand:+ start:2653 stop:3522 length:870 start_codon:yes stop_codon:yes gene_type:complete
MQIKNKKILITGGLGFVGSNLAKYLVNLNYVIVLDNLFTGKKNNSDRKIIYIYEETSQINKIKKLNKIKFDFIFHLGEYSRVEQSYDDIDKVINYNTKPFYEVIKFVKKNNAKLIYSGSSTKFGKYSDSSEISPYAWSKISNINFLKNYDKWFKLNYAITYFYNVYGDSEISTGKYATVVAKFLRLKKMKKIFVPIVYPGSQKRNFTHISDVVSGLEIVALKGFGDGYGIGSNESYSIIQLAKLLGLKYKIVPAKKGNRMSADLKVSKTKSLGWKSKHKLKDYIKQKIS